MDKEEKIKLTGYSTQRGVKSYIKNHIRKYLLLQKMFIGDVNMGKSIIIFFDFILAIIIDGAGINDYFQYNFYGKSHKERNEFIVGRKWKSMVKKFNGSLTSPLFDNKALFNNRFSEFLGRDWLNLETCSKDDLISFINTHEIFFLKIDVGSGGNEISKIKRDSISDINEFVMKHLGSKYILEEAIVQHPEIAEFNPTSVNTIRVVTIKNKGRVKIMDAVFRTGNGIIDTDNFHQHGLAMKLDVEDGRVTTSAIDKSNIRYEIHPYSHKPLLGFEIPNWNKVKETVIKAAQISEDVNYVGWDIAVLENNEVAIIEGNCSSDPDVVQITDQIGKWQKYSEEISKI